MKKDICIDFDGVLNIYKGYDENNLGEMREGCEDFLKKLSEKYYLTILTSRDAKKVQKWIEDNSLAQYIKQVTNTKIPAYLYIDDRAVRFCGNYSETINSVECFLKN